MFGHEQPASLLQQSPSNESQFFQASLPSARMAKLQADWLEGARARLLRLARIQHAASILDLGCGWGQTTLELASRCNAQVTGLDINPCAIEAASKSVPNHKSQISFVSANAAALPFPPQSFDIIFTQFSLLWMREKEAALSECRRVIKATGHLIMIEPDYDGMMEYPPSIATRELWKSLIQQAGGDPTIGRSLMVLCHSAGFDCHAYFLDRYQTPHPKYLEFLKELPATVEQKLRIHEVELSRKSLRNNDFTVHLPIWMVVAKPR